MYIAVHRQYNRHIYGTRAIAKSTALTFRIEPALKEGLCAAADKERRSIANMVEVPIRDYCGRNGVPIPDLGARSPSRRKATMDSSKYTRGDARDDR